MMKESEISEVIENYSHRAANIFAWGHMKHGQFMVYILVGFGLLAFFCLLFAGMWLMELRARLIAEGNATQYFYANSAGVYFRTKTLPEFHITNFVDRYLATRFSWTPLTVEAKLDEAEIMTTEALYSQEEKEEVYAKIRNFAAKKVTQKSERIEGEPVEIKSVDAGYMVRIQVTRYRMTLNKKFEEVTFPLCLAIVQVDPKVYDWGLMTANWKKDCNSLK